MIVHEPFYDYILVYNYGFIIVHLYTYNRIKIDIPNTIELRL